MPLAAVPVRLPFSHRLLLRSLALSLISFSLGCNAHGGASFRLNLFTERAVHSAEKVNPGAMAVFESVGHQAAPLIERHAHTSRVSMLTTHHHLHHQSM